MQEPALDNPRPWVKVFRPVKIWKRVNNGELSPSLHLSGDRIAIEFNLDNKSHLKVYIDRD